MTEHSMPTPFSRSTATAAVAVGLALIVTPAAAVEPAVVTGLWYDDTGKGAVEIKPCGPALCGAIVWLKEPRDKTGAALTDGNNPSAGKRTRPICGLPILGNVKRQDDGGWDEGWVYDPKTGNSYDVALSLETRDRLTVTGYKGMKLFGRNLSWTRAPTTLPRCDTVAATPQTTGQPAISSKATGEPPASIGAAPATGAKAAPPAPARGAPPANPNR